MSNSAGNIMQILANLPDFLRKPMLRSRLLEFYTLNNDDKRETIAMAFSAAPMIDSNKLSVLFRTWLEVLSEFDSERRAVMFCAYCELVLANASLIQKLDLELLTETFLSIDQNKRELLNDSLQEVLFSIHNRDEILKLFPEVCLKAVGLK